MSVTLHTLLYGLFAAFSPTVLLATLVVLGSGHGRINGIAFLAAFLLGQTIALLVVFVVGSVAGPDDHDTRNAAAVLEVAAGLLLMAVGLRQRGGRVAVDAPGAPRTQALFSRLEHVKPAISFGIGLPLGVGVKRLVITILAATTIAAANLKRSEEVALGALYVTVASLTVWVPVLLYLVFGPRADGLVAETRAWITTHEQQLMRWSAIGLGVFLILDGVLELL